MFALYSRIRKTSDELLTPRSPDARVLVRHSVIERPRSVTEMYGRCWPRAARSSKVAVRPEGDGRARQNTDGRGSDAVCAPPGLLGRVAPGQ
jgi:hypothetical protein